MPAAGRGRGAPCRLPPLLNALVLLTLVADASKLDAFTPEEKSESRASAAAQCASFGTS